jgi:hypothetical protein
MGSDMPIVMGLDDADDAVDPPVDPALDVGFDAAEPQAATAVRARAAPAVRTGSLS